jgi:hypothetical protein
VTKGVYGTINVYGGIVFIKNPIDNKSFATISPSPDVEVIVNGRKIDGATKVKINDNVQCRILNNDKVLFVIDVDEAKMNAYLHILPENRKFLKVLKDVSAKQHLIIETVETTEIVKELDFNHILEELERLRIQGADLSSMIEEYKRPTYEPVLIATGILFSESVDAKLVWVFPEMILDEEDNGQPVHMPLVKKGDVIALLTKEKKGEEGVTVFGEKIIPRLPKGLDITFKNTVSVLENGEVTAEIEGRPFIAKIGSSIHLEIVSSRVIETNANVAEGFIISQKDVVVLGDVSEGMYIESLGNVYIRGGVFQSEIYAMGSIEISGNSQKSQLYSGSLGKSFAPFYATLKETINEAKVVYFLSKTLRDKLPDHNAPNQINIVHSIIQTKGGKLLSFVDDSLNHLKKNQELFNELLFLKPELEVIRDLNLSLFRLQQCIEALNQAVFYFEAREKHTKSIILAQANHSTIVSGDHIYIQKQGIVQCDLTAKNNIKFKQKNSVCRGGKLDAGGTIVAVGVGGENGGGSTIVKAGKQINIDHAYACRIIFDNVLVKDIDKRIENYHYPN